MRGFTPAIDLNTENAGATLNTIAPGYIGTKTITAIDRNVLERKILLLNPMSRLGKPKEFAGPAACSASAGAAVPTGANIGEKCGQHMS